jgi:hypothetical protein
MSFRLGAAALPLTPRAAMRELVSFRVSTALLLFGAEEVA